jgi:hypothetical protein
MDMLAVIHDRLNDGLHILLNLIDLQEQIVFFLKKNQGMHLAEH